MATDEDGQTQTKRMLAKSAVRTNVCGYLFESV